MKIINRRVFHEYRILERFEAGIKLLGSEVKSVKAGHIDLSGAFVRILGSEAYLVNANIPVYPYSRPEGYKPRRSRKLLIHKKEILVLKTKIAQSRLTLAPLSCYTTRGFIKLEAGLVKGKKEYDKREELKRKEHQREAGRVFRGKI